MEVLATRLTLWSAGGIFRISIPNPRNHATSASLGEGTDYVAICKEIDVEDVNATTPSTVIDSSPTLNAISTIQLWNQSNTCKFSRRK